MLLALPSPIQRKVESFRRRRVGALELVRIDVHGGAGLTVAEPPGYRPDTYPLLYEQGGVCMSEAVEGYRGQAQLVQILSLIHI